MKDLEKFITENREGFSRFEPAPGHFDRFLDKLDKKEKGGTKILKILPWLLAAASILLLLVLNLPEVSTPSKGMELADISPKMEDTQNFFESTIRKEIAQIEKIKNEQNTKVIEDGFIQIKKLEENYENLMIELERSGENRKIIMAMISNYQQRIEVLQFIMIQLEELEEQTNMNKI